MDKAQLTTRANTLKLGGHYELKNGAQRGDRNGYCYFGAAET
jgi:hypothetical protein